MMAQASLQPVWGRGQEPDCVKVWCPLRREPRKAPCPCAVGWVAAACVKVCALPAAPALWGVRIFAQLRQGHRP